jgi:hypothetical protein
MLDFDEAIDAMENYLARHASVASTDVEVLSARVVALESALEKVLKVAWCAIGLSESEDDKFTDVCHEAGETLAAKPPGEER